MIIQIVIYLLSFALLGAGKPTEEEEKEFLAYLANAKISFSYGSLAGKENRVACFGERHGVVKDKIELTGALYSLKNAGFTHLALEMITEALQIDLDNDNYEAISKYLKEELKREHPVESLALIKTAKKLGFKIKAFGNSGKIDERNIQWAEKANDLLSENNSNKLIIYAGDIHFFYYKRKTNIPPGNSFNVVLSEDYSIPSKVFKFAGGFLSDQTNTPTEKAAYLARKHKKGHLRFAIELDNSNYIRTSDYIIHLPQW